MNKYEQTLNEYKRLEKTAKEQIKEILSRKSDNKVEFNWFDGIAPSFACSQIDEDVTDVYIKYVRFISGYKLVAKVHAYYQCLDTIEIDLEQEPYMDWFDLLMYLNETIK